MHTHKHKAMNYKGSLQSTNSGLCTAE